MRGLALLYFYLELSSTCISNGRTLAKEVIYYNQCKMSFSNKMQILFCVADIILHTISITKHNVITDMQRSNCS